MSFRSETRWLIVIGCLITSACSEKTIIREVPAENSNTTTQSELTEDPAFSTGDANLTNNVKPVVGEPVLATIGVAVPVEKPVTANMINGTSTSANQLTEDNLQTGTGNSGTTDEDLDADTNSVLVDEIEDSSTSDNQQTNLAQQSGTSDSNLIGSDKPILSDPATAEEREDANNTVTSTTNDTVLRDPDSPTAIGNPGSSVNCENTLPCQWVSSDEQFTVTVTNADNIGVQGRLTIQYSVTTLHDAQLSIASTEPAVDDLGNLYEPKALTLGQGIGGALQGAQAGSTTQARVEFDSSSGAASLANWSIGLSDTGLVRQPQFTDIPIGSATSQIADCENTLPCAWVSPTGDVTITLLLANGLGLTNRLSTNFKVESMRNTVVAIDVGATAVGSDGLRYEARTHAIGVENSAEKITANIIAGAHLAGTIFFSRTQTMSPSLQHLSLKVYEDRPVPRWNPSFTSVPIQ